MSHLILDAENANYHLYYLTRNPFPSVGVPEDRPLFCVERENEVGIISHALRLSLLGSSTHISIVASYGNGKTHLLKYIKKELENQSEEKNNLIVGYVSSVGTSFRDIYRNFMYDIGYDFLYDLSWQLLGYTTLRLIEKGKTNFTEEPERVNEYLRKDLLNIKELVNDGTVLLSSIIKEAKEKFLPVVKWQDFLTAFLQLPLEETGLLAWRWISGDPTYTEQRRELGIVTSIDTDSRALQMFMCLRKVLDVLGYRLVCLLLDEFESIEALIPIKRQLLLNSIRHLIDLNPKGLSIVIACTPEAWTDIIREYHAFSERIFREVTLKPLNKRTIKRFIERYIKNFRTSNDEELMKTLKGKGLNIGQDIRIYPFTAKALEFILQATGGNVRRVLSICNMAIDICSIKSCPLIDSDVLKKNLSDML